MKYKLTDAKAQTRGGIQWGEGVTHSGTGDEGLCSEGVIHCYTSPLVAVFMDPIYSEYLPSGRLWEAEGETAFNDGTKIGCRSLTTLREIAVPTVNLTQRAAFAILGALLFPYPEAWGRWANAWLSGADRSEDAAWAAGSAVSPQRAPAAAAWVVDDWAAARAAAWAAEATAKVTAVDTGFVRWSAARAAASTGAMMAGMETMGILAAMGERIDFAALAEQAMKY